MTREELVVAVRVTLEISKDHWLQHGTPIKPEEAEVVAVDVAAKMLMDQPPGDMKK